MSSNFSDTQSSNCDLTQLSRSDLRKHLRTARNALSSPQQSNASHNISAQLQGSAWLNQRLSQKSANTVNIALYLSHDGEVSPQLFCEYLWDLGVNVYLPIIHGATLLFGAYKKDSQWQENRFGIAEPIDPTPLTQEQLDMVCLPLVGFDKKGGRLGMGGGFYDKTFANKTSKTTLIGLAHDIQEVPQLPIESWDVPLDGIVTDNQCILCR
ncbi:5-formyltetrahydrofolate cyclo-ligase [Marinomonas sp. 2405UD68-3]|uniref:5-formyltetrahydrofolate cyclo-ligase n=1 Tax=Marinomonas sp. 2405UD68-3 TaxID=3391835 RepID=UPI0039C9DED4